MKISSKNKKYILVALLTIVLAGVIYISFVFYLLTNGFRDHQGFCSTYIPLLEKHYLQFGKYPEDINNFMKPNYHPRHEVKECHYRISENDYNFYVSEGLMGTAMYLSKTQKWIHD